ncbi:MAG: bifunctional riboflavin kinase/FAD synthetase [Methylobacteriaceae bacterium]|nr:bifunctional riboflavin kinase/FAD synthetase [Methylobacteriaceae bacterium]
MNTHAPKHAGVDADSFDTASSGSFVVVHDPVRAPAGLAQAVVAIGNFDGVHRGHAAVVARAKTLARRLGRPCVVLTFEPHPADFFAGRSVVFRLTPEPAKAAALARLGLDGMIVLRFNKALASLSAEEFIADILVERLNAAAVVVGYDFHFGRRRQGTPAYLADAARRHGFAVEVVEEIKTDAAGSLEAVHSTAARSALEQGDVHEAARLLGHHWFVIGVVEHGEKRGRALGFPTANIRLDPSCRLRHGIYAVRVRFDGGEHDGVASFGSRPTFDEGPPLLEIFIFDFAGDLYGKTMEVGFVGWLRPEEKFDGVRPLVAQMRKDAERAREMLSR